MTQPTAAQASSMAAPAASRAEPADRLQGRQAEKRGFIRQVTEQQWQHMVGPGQAPRCALEDVSNRLLDGELHAISAPYPCLADMSGEMYRLHPRNAGCFAAGKGQLISTMVALSAAGLRIAMRKYEAYGKSRGHRGPALELLLTVVDDTYHSLRLAAGKLTPAACAALSGYCSLHFNAGPVAQQLKRASTNAAHADS